MALDTKQTPALTVDELRDALSDRRLTIVAKRVGLTYAALSRVMRGGNPSRRTRLRLEEYLEK